MKFPIYHQSLTQWALRQGFLLFILGLLAGYSLFAGLGRLDRWFFREEIFSSTKPLCQVVFFCGGTSPNLPTF